MKKYDFIFLCQYFYPEYVSSATLPFDTAEHLAKEGLKVKAVCGFPGEYLRDEDVKRRETYQGIDIVRLPYLKLNRSNTIGRLLNFISFFSSALFSVRELKNCQSVIVYSNPPMLPLVALLAKRLYKTKIVFVCYDIYPELAIRSHSTNPNSILTRTMNWINKRFYPKVDLIITLSNDMKRYIEENRNINCSVKVIPNWFEDLIDNIYQAQQTQNSCSKDYFISSYFGNMGIVQDVETILDASRVLKNNSEYKFRFAGHGVKRSIVESVIKEGSSNVSLDGFLHDEAYIKALAESDCCLVSLIPGISDLCSPSKVYAYMMQGKPIVAIMDSCQLSNEIVQGQAGVHIKNGDAQSLVNFLIEAKAEPDLTEKMGLNARKLYETKYSKQICMSEYWMAIKSLMKDVKASEIM